MKTLITLLFGLALSASAQVGNYFGVTFYATNSPQVLAGMPQYWPLASRSLSTNTTLMGGEVLFAWSDWITLQNTNQAAFNAYQKSLIPAQQAQIAGLVSLYNQIPAGITQLSNDLTSLTNVYASLASGTNSTTQAVAQINQAVVAQNRLTIVLQNVLQFLQQLGPVLQQIYTQAVNQ